MEYLRKYIPWNQRYILKVCPEVLQYLEHLVLDFGNNTEW